MLLMIDQSNAQLRWARNVHQEFTTLKNNDKSIASHAQLASATDSFTRARGWVNHALECVKRDDAQSVNVTQQKTRAVQIFRQKNARCNKLFVENNNILFPSGFR